MSELQEISKYIEEYVRDDEHRKTMLAMIENGDIGAWRRLIIRRNLIITEAAQQRVKPTLLESEDILDADGELIGTRSVDIESPQSG